MHRMMRYVALFSLVLVTFCAVAVLAQAGDCIASQPGCLDTSFGSGGGATGPAGFSLTASALQTVGGQARIVALGSLFDSRNRPTNTWGMVRFLTNGGLDASFGTAGWVKGTDVPSTVAIQPDGRILVAAVRTAKKGKSSVPVLLRYDANGKVDSSFGSGGVAALMATGFGSIKMVVVQPSGQILAAGNHGDNFAVWKLTAAGAPDGTFNGNGRFIWSDASVVNSRAYAIALQMVGSYSSRARERFPVAAGGGRVQVQVGIAGVTEVVEV